MKSPWGRRGAILEHFGWTYDYLLEGIGWASVQKMMFDAPSYDYDGKDDVKHIYLTDASEEELEKYLREFDDFEI